MAARRGGPPYERPISFTLAGLARPPVTQAGLMMESDMTFDFDTAAIGAAKRAAKRSYRANGKARACQRREARQLKAAALFGMGDA